MEYQAAVDLVLQFSGETPVNAPNEHPLQGVISRFIDNSVIREQLMQWWFNVDYDFYLQPDSLGKVPISSNLRQLIFDSRDLVKRGKWVYDKQNQTYIINANVLVVQATRTLSWDELPELMQVWCMFQGARYYIVGTIGDTNITAEMKEEAKRTFVMLKTQDIEEKKVNVFRAPQIARSRNHRRPYIRR